MKPDLKKISCDYMIRTVLVVVIVVLGVWWLAGKDSSPDNEFTQNAYENISGVQGMVISVDYSGKKFTTERRVLIKENGNFRTEEDVFNFNWNEDTKFFYYKDALALGANQPWEVDHTFLTVDRNVIISTKENPAPNVNLTALEISILPGYGREQ